MKNVDSAGHVRGESIYLDDIPVRQGTLFGAVFASPLAHGRIKNLELTAAAAIPGVVRILTAEDIPGQNQIGNILPDEPLLADGEVHFAGQPIALILAESEAAAHAALGSVRVEIEPRPVVVDEREARHLNQLIVPPRTFKLGDTDAAWPQCTHIFEGVAESGGQEHLYIETQGAYAYLNENGALHIKSSTQGPTAVQRAAARVLGLAMHRIEIDVTRLGGGFGGKEDQATAWAVMAALGAHLLRKPVKIVLHRLDDMRMTGKRHPYSSDFKIGLSADLRILAYEVTFHQNAGASADLSPAVLERTLFHATNSYFVPNVKATAFSCRTNLPPNTAFRGFGGPQGMFVIESAIAKAAESLGVERESIQHRNLLAEGDSFPYGQSAESCRTRVCWSELEGYAGLANLKSEIGAFNQTQPWLKKGLAIMPICFGISFTKTHMNQASALVHIYQDGSVGISTGAVEMGQGVNTKMVQVAARILAIDPSRIKIETTNTTRVANSSPTAASASADLNGKALEAACVRLVARLRSVAARLLGLASEAGLEFRDEGVWLGNQKMDLDWNRLVIEAYFARVSLSQHTHYATPELHFDTATEKGRPFAYHAYGAAALVATLDCMRGTYRFDSVHVVHDFGQSMNPDIDLGQTEGGIVQGIGWMTMEEVVYNRDGRLLANSLSTYKVPDIYSAPDKIHVRFLDTEGSPHAIFRSKAVGEPPLMYGIGAYFAIREAIRAFRPGADVPFSAPITPEKTLLALYGVQKVLDSHGQMTARAAENNVQVLAR